MLQRIAASGTGTADGAIRSRMFARGQSKFARGVGQAATPSATIFDRRLHQLCRPVCGTIARPRLPARSRCSLFPDPDFEAEISAYRNHLEQLAHVLPAVSGRLLTEKARLEAAQAHIARAAAWAQASHKTL